VIPGSLGTSVMREERPKKKIEDLEHQIRENLQRMEVKGKEWEAENARLSRQVLFIVFGFIAAVMVVYWYLA